MLEISAIAMHECLEATAALSQLPDTSWEAHVSLSTSGNATGLSWPQSFACCSSPCSDVTLLHDAHVYSHKLATSMHDTSADWGAMSGFIQDGPANKNKAVQLHSLLLT